MSLPPVGTHVASYTEGTVYENANQVLIFAAKFAVGEASSITARQCLTRKDGTINEHAIRSLREAFGWDGTDPFWLVDNQQLRGHQVEIVVEEEENEGKTYLAVKWINPVGGGSGGGKGLPATGDRGAILAKYGNRFRALSGTSAAPKPPMKPTPAKVAAPPPVAAPPADPPAPVSGVESTREEVWEEFANQSGPNWTSAGLTAEWRKLVASLGKQEMQLTPTDWGILLQKVPATMAEALPY